MLRVVSYNIRYDNPKDGLNSWPHRKDTLCQLTAELDADVLGFQEVLHHQLQTLKETLPNHLCFGVGRNDGLEEGGVCSILTSNRIQSTVH